MKLIYFFAIYLLSLGFSAYATTSEQDSPESVSMVYAGRLMEDGRAMTGSVALDVAFSTDANGYELIETDLKPFLDVSLQDGFFQVNIQLSRKDAEKLFNTSLKPVYIQFTANGIPQPRQRFNVVPYAINALKVPVDQKSIVYNSDGNLGVGVLSSLKLSSQSSPDASYFVLKAPDGLSGGQVVLTLPPNVGTSGQILTSNGIGDLVWQTASGLYPAQDEAKVKLLTVTKSVDLDSLASSSHSAVTVGTANGLSLSGQVLSLDSSSATTTGALSSTDWGRFNSAYTAVNSATDSNINQAIVKRDLLGGFSAGAITASLNGNALTATTAGNVTGTVAVANGGTGQSTLTNGAILLGNGTSAISSTGPDTAGKIPISNGTTIAMESISGDATLSQTGALTIGGGAINSGKIASGAILDAHVSSIAPSKLQSASASLGQALQWNGSIWTPANDIDTIRVEAKTADYTVSQADIAKLLLVNGSSDVTVTLPSSASAGFYFTVKRVGTGLVTVAPTGSTINGTVVPYYLTGSQATIKFVSDGTGWHVVSELNNVICGGAVSCYDSVEAMSNLLAMTPSRKLIEYVAASGNFKVWSERGGSRILRAHGFDEWQKKLNVDGRSFSASDFTNKTILAGRVCPPNVYIDESNKFSIGNCLYYDSGGIQDGEYLANAHGTTYKWYYFNDFTCHNALKGMRLPTAFEVQLPASHENALPYTDGTPTLALSAGVPHVNGWTWTATTHSGDPNNYVAWQDYQFTYFGFNTLHNLRCVLP